MLLKKDKKVVCQLGVMGMWQKGNPYTIGAGVRHMLPLGSLLVKQSHKRHKRIAFKEYREYKHSAKAMNL